MKKPGPLGGDFYQPLTTRPWFYFIGFGAINFLLSYAPLSLKTQLSIYTFLFLPLFSLALWKWPKELSSACVEEKESLPPPRGWLVFMGLALALALRFFQLSSLSTWPIHDEGRTSFFALQQAAHWDWKLLYGYNQLPPFYYWLFAIFYKIFQPSLFTLWLFPALLSTTILFLGYALCRHFFSHSFSWLVAGLLGVSFWPLYAGRFAAEGLLVLLWEILTLLGLGLFLKCRPGPPKRLWAGGLGVWVGSGFYVHLHWPVIALMILVAAGFHLLQQKEKNRVDWMTLASLVIPLLLLPLPLLAAVWNSQFGSYISSLFAFNGHPRGWGDFLYTSFSYLTALVWGVNVDYFAYKPFWGGFLNPILGSLFFLGCVQLIQRRKISRMKWVLFSFFFFFIPAFLTNDLETFRIIQVLPLLLLITGMGLQILLIQLKPQMRILFLLFLFTPSLGLDLYHLTGPYAGYYPSHQDKWTTYAKSVHFWKSYQLLKSAADQQGPGAILLDCEFEPEDQTLVTSTYPFNASRNRSLSLDTIRWAAIFCNTDFSKILSTQFPGSHFLSTYWESTQLESSLMWNHPIGFQFIAVTAENKKILQSFVKLDRLLAQNAFEALNLPAFHSRKGLMENLYGSLDEFKESPVLQYVLWKAIAELCRKERDPRNELEALEGALRFDRPEAYLVYRRASLLVKNHRYGEAVRAFQQAGSLNPQFLPPPEVFKKLERAARP